MKTEKSTSIGIMDVQTMREMIAIFLSIDERINKLHVCSSEDFLSLNAHLKKYYSRTRVLSGLSDQLVSEGTEKSCHTIVSDLIKSFLSLESVNSKAVQELLQFKQFLEIMTSTLEVVDIPMKNLKQDLSTILFLSSSLRLNNACFKERAVNIDDLVTLLDTHVEKAKTEFVIIENTTLSLISDLRVMISFVSDLQTDEASEIAYNLNSVNERLHQELEMQIRNKNHTSALKSKVQQSISSTDEIVTQLQYHDIIRQKMDHILATHKEIISNLSALENGQNMTEDAIRKLMHQIPDIAELQVAQLMLTNNEYQSAIGNITRKFLAYSEEIGRFVGISKSISDSNTQNCDGFAHEVNMVIQGMHSRFFKFNGKLNDLPSRLYLMLNRINNLSEVFGKFHQHHVEMESLVSTILDTVKTPDNSGIEKEDIPFRMKELLSDIQVFMNSIHSQLEKTHLLSDDFANNPLEIMDIQQPKDRLGNILQLITDSVNQFVQRSGKNKESLNEVFSISAEMAENIKVTLTSVKYYDYFEHEIKQIIEKLNSIYFMLRSNTLELSIDERQRNLNFAERKYTMQTEHDIHSNILNKTNDKNTTNSDKSIQNQTNEDDVELF